MSSTAGTESVDRQRQRAQRTAGGAGASSRLPAAPKRRRPAVAALAALLVVGGALIAGLLAVRMDERQSYLQVSRDIAAGERIEVSDLTVTRVAADVPGLMEESQARVAIGKYMKVAFSKGQLLDSRMLTDNGPLQDGKAAVGIALAEGRYPAGGLTPGDQVRLLRIGAVSTPGAVLGDAVVLDVKSPTDKGSGLGSKSSSSETQTVTVLVDQVSVSAVADASGNNKIAVALLKSGTSLKGR
ncbi:SAF domain-containing protein [Kribbella sp. NPDC056345]|uniref:SAF domain-containing protein n=1 Tax=Kribbella sp. NPDC056345 TaxID=3345789 RepID=UPI0035D7BC4E